MAKWHTVLTLCAAGLALAGPASAAPDSAPVWSLATSLAGLPPGVSAYLTENTGLADQGGAYNDSCVVNPDIPSTRFVIAALSEGVTIVAIEHGGRGHGINTWAFRQENNQWKPMERGHVAYNVTLMTAKILVEQHQKSTQRL